MGDREFLPSRLLPGLNCRSTCLVHDSCEPSAIPKQASFALQACIFWHRDHRTETCRTKLLTPTSNRECRQVGVRCLARYPSPSPNPSGIHGHTYAPRAPVLIPHVRIDISKDLLAADDARGREVCVAVASHHFGSTHEF
jgi:hypothetical protein